MTDFLNGNCWHCGKKVEKSSERNPKTCDYYFYCNPECKSEYQRIDREKRILTNQTHHSRYENKPKFFGKESLSITTKTTTQITEQPVVEVSTIGEEATDTKKKNKKPGRMKKKEKNDKQ